MKDVKTARISYNPDGSAFVEVIFEDGSHKLKLFNSKRIAVQYVKDLGLVYGKC